jgi:hypothetical protein
MKKLILILACALSITFGFSQISPYHNLIINQTVHYQGDSITSCYIVIEDVMINSLKELQANYILKVYKNKQKYLTNKQWTIQIKELEQLGQIKFTPDFTQGDLFIKISEALKEQLLAINKTWLEENIIIE